MKISYCFLVLVLIILSCDTDKDYNYLTYITAGQEDGIGILYVDIEPDDTLRIFNCELEPHSERDLDLNNDQVIDFRLEYKVSNCSALGGSWGYLGIVPLGNNSICVSKEESSWAEALYSNDTINENNTWSDSTALLFEHLWNILVGPVYYYGYWRQDADIFVAVKIMSGDYVLYGWIDIKRNILRRYAISMPFRP
jgi:hypothetical protein